MRSMSAPERIWLRAELEMGGGSSASALLGGGRGVAEDRVNGGREEETGLGREKI